MRNRIGCICLSFLHCGFSNVSSNRWHKRMQNCIGCTSLIFLCHRSLACEPDWLYFYLNLELDPFLACTSVMSLAIFISNWGRLRWHIINSEFEGQKVNSLNSFSISLRISSSVSFKFRTTNWRGMLMQYYTMLGNVTIWQGNVHTVVLYPKMVPFPSP